MITWVILRLRVHAKNLKFHKDLSPMRIAYFDCFSGISGNMTLGALLACGLAQDTLQQGLEELHLAGWGLSVSQVRRRGIQACYVDVEMAMHSHDHAEPHGHHHQPHRGL